MKIAFVGLWHLGSVMSAVLAKFGHEVTAVDDADVVERFRRYDLPVYEPGLLATIETQVRLGSLRFESSLDALAPCEIVWITYDTPVSDDGTAAADFVLDRATALFPFLPDRALVVISSQLPVGSVAELERRAAAAFPQRHLRFASSPENLRLGQAIKYLEGVDRFVIGARTDEDARLLVEAFAPLSSSVEVMSVESAEMTKHALNAFLATSIAFINELAALCELTGADAREVERGLKSDARIGNRAYVRAGASYAGGTLARDVNFIIDSERRNGLEPYFFEGVRAANDRHGSWFERRFMEVVGEPAGRTIAILGLVYKPGTDTLRGSSAVAFARWFVERGGRVSAFDPVLRELPEDLREIIALRNSAAEALAGAEAVFVGTDYKEFRSLGPASFTAHGKTPVIFDPSRFLSETIQTDHRLRYYSIGLGARV